MEFSQPKGIYLQIADQIRDRIVEGRLTAGERIPSIRELAIDLGVNPNTVTKSYQTLMEHRIINNQRGLGYFVDSDAKQRILGDRRKQFVREELPRLFRTMRQLDIGIDELVEYYRQATGDDSDER